MWPISYDHLSSVVQQSAGVPLSAVVSLLCQLDSTAPIDTSPVWSSGSSWANSPGHSAKVKGQDLAGVHLPQKSPPAQVSHSHPETQIMRMSVKRSLLFRTELSSLSTWVDTLHQAHETMASNLTSLHEKVQQHSTQLFVLQQHIDNNKKINKKNNFRVSGQSLWLLVISFLTCPLSAASQYPH